MILLGKEIDKRIGVEIYYHTIEGEFENYSSNKYQNNNGIQPSLLYKDFEKIGFSDK